VVCPILRNEKKWVGVILKKTNVNISLFYILIVLYSLFIIFVIWGNFTEDPQTSTRFEIPHLNFKNS
jgi:hypothetical protein